MKAFVGLASYYGKFIQNISTKMYPLYNLLKNTPFDWNRACQDSFLTIKKEITADSTLIHFDSKLPLVLTCDASAVGIGAVLAHTMPHGKEIPIAFTWRSLQKAELNYGVIQKEVSAIVFGTNI